MSDISVGNVSTSGTRNRLSGTSSGLNTDALIENAVKAHNQKADRIDIRVGKNQSKIGGYEKYFGLSQNLQDSVKSLKSVTSQLGISESAFKTKTGTLSSDGVNPEGLISPRINPGAVAGTYNITVLQKAEPMTVQTQIVPSRTADLNYTGAFEIGLVGNVPATINVTADMSLEEIAAAINNTSSTTGVSASILRISETSYRLVLRGTETNVGIDVTTLSGTILGDLGLTDGADNFLPAQITQPAQGSVILFGSTQISRDGNTYDDLVPGLEFDVTGADPATTITLSVLDDTAKVKTAINDFITAYNELRDFFILNQTVGADGTVPKDAVLFSNNLLEDLSSSLFNTITNSFTDEESAVQSLRDLGIELDQNNKLVLKDEAKLDDALLNNFNDVEDFFSTSSTISNSQLGLITNTSRTKTLDFTVNITMSGSNISSVSVTGGGDGVFDIDGTRLVGRAGTAFEGLTFAYIGTVDASISVLLKAGLADQLFNAVEPYTNAANGLVKASIDELTDTNDELQLDASEIRARGEVIREQQIQKYSEMEARLETAKGLLSQIRAILGTNRDDR